MTAQMSYTEARKRFAEVLDRAVHDREAVVITRRGAPNAVVLAEDEYRRVRRVQRLDVSGTAASAVVTLDYPDVFFTDHMALLKIAGRRCRRLAVRRRRPKRRPNRAFKFPKPTTVCPARVRFAGPTGLRSCGPSGGPALRPARRKSKARSFSWAIRSRKTGGMILAVHLAG